MVKMDVDRPQHATVKSKKYEKTKKNGVISNSRGGNLDDLTNAAEA
jgi:hypothetical protein